MKYFMTALAATIGFTMTGCADKEPEYRSAQCTIDNLVAPLWACGDSKIEGSFTAVGSASLSQLGQGISRREAMNNARLNLSKKLQADVNKKVRLFMESAELGHTDTISTQISENIASTMPVSSKQMRYWQSSATKEIYVLVGVAQNEIDLAIKDAIRSQYQNGDALQTLDERFPTY